MLAHGEPVDDEFDIIGSTAFVADRLTVYRDAGVDEFIIRDHAAIPLTDAIESVGLLGRDVVPTLSLHPGRTPRP